jgi:hypothetical protein
MQKRVPTLAEDRREDNPANLYWPYVVSKVGRIRITRSGTYTAALQPSDIPIGQKVGITLVFLRLVPVR